MLAAEDHETGGRRHFNGLKLLDPRHLLLSSNADPYAESGPAYSYEWRTNRFLEVESGRPVHET